MEGIGYARSTTPGHVENRDSFPSELSFCSIPEFRYTSYCLAPTILTLHLILRSQNVLFTSCRFEGLHLFMVNMTIRWQMYASPYLSREGQKLHAMFVLWIFRSWCFMLSNTIILFDVILGIAYEGVVISTSCGNFGFDIRCYGRQH